MARPLSNKTFRIVPRGPFSLEASARFLEAFAPAAHRRERSARHPHLAFALEGSWETVGVCLRQRDKALVGDLFGDADPRAVRSQAARILSLDVDASGFLEVGRRDPVVGRLQRAYPGLRPGEGI